MFWYIAAIVANILLVGFDKFTKHLAETRLQPISRYNIIDGVFELYFLTNEGAAFGIFQGGRWAFISLTAIILCGIIIYYIKMPKMRYEWLFRVSLILVIAGALGNFIDRLMRGYVVDFFYFRLINFPVFNMADIYVVVGTVLLIAGVLFFSEELKYPANTATEENEDIENNV